MADPPGFNLNFFVGKVPQGKFLEASGRFQFSLDIDDVCETGPAAPYVPQFLDFDICEFVDMNTQSGFPVLVGPGTKADPPCGR
jgi:hypothetical protein